MTGISEVWAGTRALRFGSDVVQLPRQGIRKGDERRDGSGARPHSTCDTMGSNIDTVETYLEGFRRSDHATVLSCLTDDVEWDIPGFFQIAGKAAFDAHIEEEGFVGPPEIDVSRVTDAGDIVFVEGEVRGARADGTRFRLAICDVFEMRTGKIRRLTSYLMEVP